MSAELITRLIQAGTPADLVAEVAMALGKAEADRNAIAERRSADRDRQARLRNVKSRDVTLHNVTARDKQPAKDARTHEGARPTETNLTTTDLDLDKTPPSEGKNPAKAKPDRKTRIASDAQPAERDRTIAAEIGMDSPTFRHEWSKFREHHVAVGSVMTNWTSAWRKWSLGWVDRGAKPIGTANGHHARAGPDPTKIRDPMLAAIHRRYGKAPDEPDFRNPDELSASAYEH